jgi:uncharacterized alpha/beta hydrolase family protein
MFILYITSRYSLLIFFLANLAAVSRGEDLKKSANQKQELPVAAMFVNGSGQNEQSLERTFHRCFLPSFTGPI